MRLRLFAAVILLAVSGCAAPKVQPSAVLLPTPDGMPISIPLNTGALAARLCWPASPGRHRVVVINHGSPSSPALRATMQPTRCDTEAALWFTRRGFLVVFPMRRGFGASTGPVDEDTGACVAPDYLRSAQQGARDINVVLRFVTALPYAQPNHAIVIGQSTGGWAAIGAASLPTPLASVYISFAGGRGAHAYLTPPRNCRPDLLIAAAARLGATATTPMLWITAQNDHFFPPDLMQSLHDAYLQAGGRGQLAITPPIGDEGHFLFYAPGGSEIWGPILNRYLSAQPAS